MNILGFTDAESFVLIGIAAVIAFGVQIAICFTAEGRWIKWLSGFAMLAGFLAGLVSLTRRDFVLNFWGNCGWGLVVGEAAAWATYSLLAWIERKSDK